MKNKIKILGLVTLIMLLVGCSVGKSVGDFKFVKHSELSCDLLCDNSTDMGAYSNTPFGYECNGYCHCSHKSFQFNCIEKDLSCDENKDVCEKKVE